MIATERLDCARREIEEGEEEEDDRGTRGEMMLRMVAEATTTDDLSGVAFVEEEEEDARRSEPRRAAAEVRIARAGMMLERLKLVSCLGVFFGKRKREDELCVCEGVWVFSSKTKTKKNQRRVFLSFRHSTFFFLSFNSNSREKDSSRVCFLSRQKNPRCDRSQKRYEASTYRLRVSSLSRKPRRLAFSERETSTAALKKKLAAKNEKKCNACSLFSFLRSLSRCGPILLHLSLSHSLSQETKAVFEKLHKYIGKNIRKLVEIPSSKNADGDDGDDKPSTSSDDDAFVFRLHRNRVYYVRASLMRRATSVSRDRLVHLGTAVGRLTHSGKFRLTVGALDLLSQHAKYKVRKKRVFLFLFSLFCFSFFLFCFSLF